LPGKLGTQFLFVLERADRVGRVPFFEFLEEPGVGRLEIGARFRKIDHRGTARLQLAVDFGGLGGSLRRGNKKKIGFGGGVLRRQGNEDFFLGPGPVRVPKIKDFADQGGRFTASGNFDAESSYRAGHSQSSGHSNNSFYRKSH
jgi:hypothetical protein